MRLLGIDYGTKRIGLAVGETSPFFVTPLKTLPQSHDLVQQIIAVAKEEKVETIVVGWPVSLTGQAAGETLSLVREFIATLRQQTDLAVIEEDERFTTTMADRLHREAGVTKKEKFDRDALAAALLLETYIEKSSTKF